MRLLSILLLSGCTVGAIIISDVGIDDTDVDSESETESETDPGPQDQDRDGFTEDVDCNDGDAEVFPGAEERCDSTDWNCNDNAFDDACPCETVSTDLGVMSMCRDSEPFGRAAGICDGAGMHLAWPDGPEMNELLHDVAREFRRDIWIGITDSEREDRWMSVTNERVEWDNWSRGQPDNWNRNEDCAQLRSWTGEWNDIQCDARFSFVCRSE